MSMQAIKGETFADQVRAIPGGENLDVCFACGTCVSKCMIQQKLEPEYNPRKLIRMVMLGMREEAYSNPTTWLCSECDLCYSACPQEIHISEVISAVRQMAIQAGFSSPIETVTVDETACSGCGICGMACPYEAPSLVEKMVNGQMDRVSEVDENRCRGCGICVAACPTGAISRPGVSNQEIIDQTIFSKSSNGDPRMVVFICDWCLRAAADEKILESYPENVRIIHIPCSGRIDPEIALRALNSGIDGVMICGCKPGECHFKRGNLVNACKIGTLDLMFDDMGLGEKRVNFVQIGTLERGRVRKEVDSMLEKLTARKEIQQ